MEEIEVPTEHLHETIEEKVEESIEKKERGWSMYVAISTALIAVFAALSALMAGHHSDEALISQIRASDQWAYYQAKSIKAEIKKLEIHTGQEDQAALDQYRAEQEKIKKDADDFEDESALHLQRHMKLSRAVTLFQIAIAMSAIAILTKKKFLWYISILLALAGVWLFILGLL